MVRNKNAFNNIWLVLKEIVKINSKASFHMPSIFQSFFAFTSSWYRIDMVVILLYWARNYYCPSYIFNKTKPQLKTMYDFFQAKFYCTGINNFPQTYKNVSVERVNTITFCKEDKKILWQQNLNAIDRRESNPRLHASQPRFRTQEHYELRKKKHKPSQ